MHESLYIAVDLGAGSGRVFLARLTADSLLLEEMRRFHYPPSRIDGHLRWDITKIFEEVKAGAKRAAERAREIGGTIHSIGVDSWGVDYGLLDREGKLIELPIAYRDQRTDGIMEKVFTRVSREEVFQRTGIQFLTFNTLFQLYAHARTGLPEGATRMLMIPGLINYFLTGRAATEYTNATTTQMIGASTGEWDFEMIGRLDLPLNLFAEIIPAGTGLGEINGGLSRELGLERVRVVAPASHDTGSAVAGAPLQDQWAFISSGTWSLAGVEMESPLINSEVLRRNFTNEGGAYGGVRFLKNVMGLWILESCRVEWRKRGIEVGYDSILSQAAAIEGFPGLIFPDDERFLNPPSMLEAVATQLAETRQSVSDEPAALTKVILDSLAFRYASVLRSIESLTNREIKGVQIIGGGSQNGYLNQMTATATGKPVLAGPSEATAIGNVLVQAIAGGRFASLGAARRFVGERVQLRRFMPRPSAALDDAARRYLEIEARFMNQALC